MPNSAQREYYQQVGIATVPSDTSDAAVSKWLKSHQAKRDLRNLAAAARAALAKQSQGKRAVMQELAKHITKMPKKHGWFIDMVGLKAINASGDGHIAILRKAATADEGL